DASLEETRNAAETQGLKGDVLALSRFEDVADAHKGRILNVQNGMRAIEVGVRTGTILMDKALLQKLTPAERDEFVGFVRPSVRQRYRDNNPELFQDSPITAGEWVPPA